MESTYQQNIWKYNSHQLETTKDELAVEEPLEIRLGTEGKTPQSISITMRTPGNDFELAIGFLFTEGIIRKPEEVKSVAFQASMLPGTEQNIVQVVLQKEVKVDTQQLDRHFYTSSSCGVCGKTSIDAVRASGWATLPAGRPRFAAELITGFPDLLRQQQDLFETTGGIHAAGLFDVSGKLLLLREDVGRHNAVDKLIGAAFQAHLLPLQDTLIMVSGRASFELIQKSAMAGIPILAAVGAPSSLAVSLAREAGMTVLGFVRDQKFNLYCGPERIIS